MQKCTNLAICFGIYCVLVFPRYGMREAFEQELYDGTSPNLVDPFKTHSFNRLTKLIESYHSDKEISRFNESTESTLLRETG